MHANKCQDMLAVAVLLAGYVLCGNNAVLQVYYVSVKCQQHCLCAVYPDLSSREMIVPTETIVRGIGVQLETAQIADLLSRMQLQAQPVQGSAAVRVLVPPTRSDVLHACDVMEVSRFAGPLVLSWCFWSFPSSLCMAARRRNCDPVSSDCPTLSVAFSMNK